MGETLGTLNPQAEQSLKVCFQCLVFLEKCQWFHIYPISQQGLWELLRGGGSKGWCWVSLRRSGCGGGCQRRQEELAHHTRWSWGVTSNKDRSTLRTGRTVLVRGDPVLSPEGPGDSDREQTGKALQEKGKQESRTQSTLGLCSFLTTDFPSHSSRQDMPEQALGLFHLRPHV